MAEYYIPAQDSETEFSEKRSRFIGHVWHVETEEKAREKIAEMKAKYYDARHNCWCYRVGPTTARYSDDGEPQGTAGQPMLKVLEREEVTNVCCVVTRYFGGILLGVGGLTRAYSKGAKDALIASGVAVMGAWARVEVPCTYPLFERVKLEIEGQSGVIDDVAYGADVVLSISLPAEKAEALQARLTELSAGSITIRVLSEEYRPGPRVEVK